ncbi:MAG: EamA family transporter [Bacteroidales bacterium]
MNQIKGFIYACLSAATFGLIPLFANTAILQGVHNDTILSYRYSIAAIAYGLFLILGKTNLKISRKQTKEILIAGVGGYGITAFFLLLAYLYMPTGVATSIHFLYPVVVTILMSLIYKERLSIWVKMALLIAIAGTVCLSWQKGRVQWEGIVFILLSTITYGSYLVALNRPTLKNMNPSTLTFWVLLFTALFYLLLGFSRGSLVWISSFSFLKDMFLLGIVSTVISARLIVSAVKLIGSVSSSILGTLEPITAILTGIFFFHEPFTLINFIGFIFIVAAVIMVLYNGKKNSSPTIS